MFKWFVVIAVLLAGCIHKVETQPRLVKLPSLPQEYISSLEENCVWETFDEAVFNQKSQRLKFRYQNCKPFRENILWVEKGDTLQYQLNIDYIQKKPAMEFAVLKLYKLGTFTPQEFLSGQLSKYALESGLCTIVEIEPGLWTIDSLFEVELPNFETLKNWTRPDDPCGEYVSYLKHDIQGEVYVFKEGIVFKIGGPGIGDIINLSSVAYVNRG